MRIYKQSASIDEDINKIAGEMLNIESSTLTFINGAKVDVPKGQQTGYPRFVVDGITHIIKAAEGHIYVSRGTNLEEFEEKICDAIQFMEKEHYTVEDGGKKYIDHLHKYQTFEHGLHTNLKLKSSLKLTYRSNGNNKSNTKRLFRLHRQMSDKKNARFIWCIIPIESFEFKIDSMNIDQSISARLCSIFYDSDNICKHPDGATVQEFSGFDLVGYDNLLKEDITLSKYWNPVCFEISSYWKDHAPDYSANMFFRNIPPAKVYKRDFNNCEIKPRRISERATDVSRDICSYCCTVLYDWNYVLYGNVKNPDSKMGTAICPICLHRKDGERAIENKYLYVCRVQFPRTIASMIDSSDASEVKKDIMREALKRISKDSYSDGEKTFEYYNIGDKYIGLTNSNDYLFSKLSAISDRKVCLLNRIQLLQ